MTRPSWVIFNFLVMYFLFLLTVALETSLFHWMLGWRATFQLSLVIIVYMCLQRGTIESLLFVVLALYSTGLYSGMLSSVAVFGGACLFVGLRILKSRFYSPNPTNFVYVALSSILAFHLITWITNVIFTAEGAQAHPLDWIIEVLLTALVARWFYRFLIVIDQRTKRLAVSELDL